ncbi:MAG: retroviral-like aspartic protease family protein [Planctomycetia bacterium]|nr:retroviral-like aspartic protease family protein [Planctomycetia bacterium]
MADLGFRADIVTELTRNTGLLTVSIQIDLEVWDGATYGLSQPFVLDTGAEVTTLSASLARALGLRTVGGRRVNLRGVAGTTPGLLIPFRFRFARWPTLEVTDSSCVIVPGEKDRGLLAFRDIHPRLEFFKLGNDLFFVPPPA